MKTVIECARRMSSKVWLVRSVAPSVCGWYAVDSLRTGFLGGTEMSHSCELISENKDGVVPLGGGWKAGDEVESDLLPWLCWNGQRVSCGERAVSLSNQH